MKTSSIAVETSRSISQSHSIVRQTNKRSFLSDTTMNNIHIFNDSTNEFASAAEDFPETPKTGKQLAHALIASAKTKAIKAAKSKAKEYALKRLQTQPGWQPFGAQPLKRKLHGKDWTATPFKPYKKKS